MCLPSIRAGRSRPASYADGCRTRAASNVDKSIIMLAGTPHWICLSHFIAFCEAWVWMR